jgi:hypothetical protein
MDLDKILAECCKICGIYLCGTHPADEWVVCVGCPNSGKYWLRYHDKCPYCGAAPPAVPSKDVDGDP